MNRNCFKKAGTITTAQAAIAANTNRLVSEVHNMVPSGARILVDLYHNYDEFMEFVAHVNGADAQTNTVLLYAARGDNDDYTYVASLAYTVGTAKVRGGSRLYCDTLVATEVDEAFELVASNSADNEQVKCWFNTNGYSKFLFIAPTLNSTDLSIEYATSKRDGIPLVS